MLTGTTKCQFSNVTPSVQSWVSGTGQRMLDNADWSTWVTWLKQRPWLVRTKPNLFVSGQVRCRCGFVDYRITILTTIYSTLHKNATISREQEIWRLINIKLIKLFDFCQPIAAVADTQLTNESVCKLSAFLANFHDNFRNCFREDDVNNNPIYMS